MTKKLLKVLFSISVLFIFSYGIASAGTYILRGEVELVEQNDNLGASVFRIYQGGTNNTSYTDGQCILYNAANDRFESTACGAGGTTTVEDLLLTQGYTIVGDGSNNASATSSIFIDENGNVGIGINTPEQILHLYNADLAELKIQNPSGGSGSTAKVGIYSNGGERFSFETDGSNSYLTAKTGTNYLRAYSGDVVIAADETDSTPDKDIRFFMGDISTPSNEVARLDYNGYFGIGDTSPDATLEIAGTSANGYFMVSSAAAEDGNVFIIDEDGDVGIGLSNPTSFVELSKDISPVDDLSRQINHQLTVMYPADTNGKSAGIGFGVTTGEDVLGASIYHTREGSNSYGGLSFATRASGGTVTEKMKLSSDGYLGIGTTTPTEELSVEGDAWVNGTVRSNNVQKSCWNISSSTDLISGEIILAGADYDAITVIKHNCKVGDGTTQQVYLSDGTNDMDTLTCSSTRNFISPTTNNTFTAFEDKRLELGTNTGGVTEVDYCIYYRVTPN